MTNGQLYVLSHVSEQYVIAACGSIKLFQSTGEGDTLLPKDVHITVQVQYCSY